MESGFPLTRFLVPQPDEVTADLDGQCVETKKPEFWHDTCHSEMLEDTECSDPLLASWFLLAWYMFPS
jgi:hypothetical protein